MIQVAIVEDNCSDAQRIVSFLDAWCGENPQEALSHTVYSDAVKFLESGCHNADIVFMDIEMPYMNGMDAAAAFRKLNQDAILIFATRATRYAVRGYAVDAIGYLVKPFGGNAFRAVLEKAIRLHQARTGRQTIILKTGDGVMKIDTDRIRYIEAVSHMLHVHTAGQIYRVWSGIDKIKEQLPAHFVVCHRGYIVNIKHIDCVQKDGVRMVGEPDVWIPISRQRRADFMQELTGYYVQTMRG